MGKGIIIFCIVVIAFFVLGAVHGYGDANQPDALIHNALRYSHFGVDQEKRVDLIYACDADVYVWDVDAKRYSITLQEATRRLQSGRGSPGLPSTTTPRIAALSSALGGGVAAWNLKDAVTAVREGNVKQARLVAVTLAGALSGYAAGYWLGSRALPRCSSDIMLSMLDDSLSAGLKPSSAAVVWRKLEKFAYESKTVDIFSTCAQIDDNATREACKSAVTFLYHRGMDPSHKLTSGDVDILLKIDLAVRKMVTTQPVGALARAMNWLVLLPVAAVLLLGGIFAYSGWSDWYARRKRELSIVTVDHSDLSDHQGPT